MRVAVICAYGVNRKTPTGYDYDLTPEGELKLRRSYFEERERVVDDRGEVVEVDSRRRISGDGTVPYFSLSWCHHWLGGIANITYAPQENYPADDVQTWDNMEVKTFNKEHRQPDELGRPMNAFFEMRGAATADGEYPTTEVWEIDGVRHKVTSPLWPAASEVVCPASCEV